jgi:hypothetical protein
LCHHPQARLKVLQARIQQIRAKFGTVTLNIIHGSCIFEQDQAPLSFESPFIHLPNHYRASVSTSQGQKITNPALHSNSGQEPILTIHEIMLWFL